MNTLRIKKNDLVKIIAGSHKGKTGKVERISSRDGVVYIEKIGMIKRHVKPSQVNPRGGTKEIHKGFPVSNVVLIVDEAKGTTSRVAYKVTATGKTRVAKATKKEVK